jgi:hypothetical protein
VTRLAPHHIAAAGVAAGVLTIGLFLYGRTTVAPDPKAPAGAPVQAKPPAIDTTAPLKVTITPLGRAAVSRFAFDASVAERVVACDAVSTDGGRSWPALVADALQRPMMLGRATAVAPVAGPAGRFLCGDVILGGDAAASGRGDIHPVAEWDGAAFRAVGLPALSRDHALQDLSPTTSVGYAPDGQAIATRGAEILLAEGRFEAPGKVEAFAMDAHGRVVAAVHPTGQRQELMAADALGGAWTPVPAPGVVKAVAAGGDRVYVAADQLGRRDAEGRWSWTPWPPNVRPEHLAVLGDVVVAWGRLYPAAYHVGAIAVSRDGGATVRFAALEKRPLWVALDPAHPGELLATLEARNERELVRLRIEPPPATGR